MELEIIEPSVWGTVTGILCALGVFALIAGLVFFAMGRMRKVPLIILFAGLLVAWGAGITNSNLFEQRTEQMQTSFSQQLHDEYNSTSSDSLEEISRNLAKYKEASTVFTRDGEQTAVFIKKIGEDDKKLTMIFTVVDEKALYPKEK